MSCPECGAATNVVDSRVTKTRVRRRRLCDSGHRFTTYELLATEHETIAAAALEMSQALLRLMTAVEQETPVLPQGKMYRPRAA